MPLEEQGTKLCALQSFAIADMPARLYRFRICNERNIDAFYKNQLWATTADCMNDAFDARVFFPKEEVKQYFESITVDTVKDLLLNRKSSLSSEWQQLAEQSVLTLPEETLLQALTQTVDYIHTNTAQAMLETSEAAQRTIKFCCFSEKLTSPYMWGLYAANETGFCLEYDFSSMPYVSSGSLSKTIQSLLFPIVYKQERYKVPADYIIYLLINHLFNTLFDLHGIDLSLRQMILGSVHLPCPDITVATKLALYKSTEWSGEAEWRLFCSSIDDSAFQQAKKSFVVKQPTGIYLGRRISQIYEKILCSLSAEKGIPVYKMALNDELPSYELIYNTLLLR